jgi:serine/threonine protein kinase
MYGDAEAFVFDMHADLFKHHTIMQQLGGGINYILGSHVFGSICGVEGAQVPALLKDRAEMGSVAQQLTQLQQGRRAGLGSRQAHAVVIMAVDGLMDLHDAGWAHLNTMPANIVSSMRSTLTGGNPYIHYSLVGFGSAINVGASRTVQQVVPGTAGYQSPEWRNSNLVGVKADIWAVGVLLLELRAGVALSDDLLQGLMQQSSHASTLAAMRQSATYSHLGEDEWACVTACLTYDHTERPEAAELIKLPYLQL